MLITHEDLKKINLVQIDMLRDIARVCSILNITFFMVHGSLLGTIRNSGFVPDDDDIDIAMKRSDYELFIKEAPKHLASQYFVQTQRTDPQYPLDFAKLRDSSTTYICEATQKLHINHGVYLDIFPIDFCEKSKFKRWMFEIKYRLLTLRISKIYTNNHSSLKNRIACAITCAIVPTCQKAIIKRNNLLTKGKSSQLVRISGGKRNERVLDIAWFSSPQQAIFEGINVFIPNGYDSYLSVLYGDYKKRTLVENKISDKDFIEVNACKIDLDHSYTQYIQ